MLDSTYSDGYAQVWKDECDWPGVGQMEDVHVFKTTVLANTYRLRALQIPIWQWRIDVSCIEFVVKEIGTVMQVLGVSDVAPVYSVA